MFGNTSELVIRSIDHVVSVVRQEHIIHFTNRPNYGLAYKVSGQAAYYSNGEKKFAKAGTLVFLPKGINYDVEHIEAGECIAVNFDLANDIPDAQILSFEFLSNEIIREKFKKLNATWRYREDQSSYSCMSILYSILNLIEQNSKNVYIPSAKAELLNKAKAFIQKNFSNPDLRVADVSGHCEISEVYLRKLFYDSMHLPPLAYITFLRMNLAKDLLSAGESVFNVAEQVGYSDTFYFSKRFTKDVGMSPSEYRRKYKG